MRNRIVSVIAASVALALSSPPGELASADQEPTPAPPNILLIVSDDQRVDTMEAMPRTTRIFQEGGVTYPNAFATTPLCCPSRASILTGLYVHNHEVRSQARAGQTLDVGLTLQRYLRDSGYYTGMTGKWLNGWSLDVAPPYLDEVAIFNSSGISYADATWNVDGRTRVVPGHATDFLIERAEGFVRRAERDDDRPWFLVVTPPQPHSPYTPEPRFAERDFTRWEGNPAVAESDKSDKPDWVEDRKASRYHGRRLRAKQLRTLLSVDRIVARTFRAMREHGEARDTLAIYTSDNGYMWAEHGIVDNKRYPYTPSVQVPLFARWPGRLIPGLVDARLAANIDVGATVLEASGNLDRLSEVDGRSLVAPSSRQRLLLEYWASPEKPLPTWAAVRTHDYQYIEYYDRSDTLIYREYYDLVEDPFMLENLFDNGTVLDDPEWVTLSQDLQRLRDCRGPTCP